MKLIFISLVMIKYDNIKTNEIITVSVEGEVDDAYARIYKKTDGILYVTYLTEGDEFTEEGYGLWYVDRHVSAVHMESVTGHYEGVTKFEDIQFMNVGPNLFVDKKEIEEDRDDEDDSSLDGFIVRDSDVEGVDDVIMASPGWSPKTPGQRRFMRTLDRIEARVRHENDDKLFSN